MLREELDSKIANATVMSIHNPEHKREVDILRLIKSEYLKYNVSKEALRKPMNDDVEISILKKMVKQRKESADMYNKGNRPELAEQELWEADYIEQFLPRPADPKEVEKAIDRVALDYGIIPVQKNLGQIIKKVKEYVPNADNKTIADIIKKRSDQ